jgi:hypothetical protein
MEDNNRLNNQISKDNNTNIIDDSVNNSSTSEDSGIFSSINLGNESEIQTPSTSPPRRPIYAPETTKGDSVLLFLVHKLDDEEVKYSVFVFLTHCQD